MQDRGRGDDSDCSFVCGENNNLLCVYAGLHLVRIEIKLSAAAAAATWHGEFG